MQMENIFVLIFMTLPFLVFLGLKYLTYQRQKKLELSEEINSILSKHSKTFGEKTKDEHSSDHNKAA